MASSLTIRFTDEEYLNKRGLIRAMKTTFVDTFWNEVLDYRRQYRKDLGISLMNKSPIYFTMSPAIELKLRAFEDKMYSYLRIYRNLNDREKFEVRKNSFFPLLNAIRLYEGATSMSDISLRALLNGTYNETTIEHSAVINYFHTINYYLDEKVEIVRPDADFLGNAFTFLLGTPELVKFYREEGPKTNRPTSIINGFDYDKAPAREIESMMERLFESLDLDMSLFLKSMIALFDVAYIQPFDNFNYPLAILLSKEVVANGALGSNAFILPYETLLMDHTVTEAMKDTKKEGDLTYFVMAAMNVLSRNLDALIEQAKKARISVYEPEYRNLSSEEEKRAEEVVPNYKKEPEPLFQDLLAPQEEIKDEPIPEPVPIIRNIQEEEKPAQKEKEHKNALKPSKIITVEEMKENQNPPSRSFEVPSNYLSDKEVKEYVRYLLETNPNLNKKQASFLANHCTPNRYYTIQQYKSFCRCAYETARTSMDHLTSEGYYEKLQVKNKFVYRLAKKGE